MDKSLQPSLVLSSSRSAYALFAGTSRRRRRPHYRRSHSRLLWGRSRARDKDNLDTVIHRWDEHQRQADGGGGWQPDHTESTVRNLERASDNQNEIIPCRCYPRPQSRHPVQIPRSFNLCTYTHLQHLGVFGVWTSSSFVQEADMQLMAACTARCRRPRIAPFQVCQAPATACREPTSLLLQIY